ncbi:MAG: HAD family hydrolase [Candidatus Nanoarchaeia archaeon]|nr:HAD family hydrolase [Candidatus Nanoarchaeia archaeon]
MTDLYVFDFHGVLEKGTENAVMLVSNMALESKNYFYRMTPEDAVKYYGLKWGEIFEKMIKVSKEKANELYEECKKIDDINPGIITRFTKQNNNASIVLDKIIQKKHDYILISNTRPKALSEFIKSAELEKYFKEDNTFAVNKHESGQALNKELVLREYLSKRNYDRIIIIGDSPGDIELKKVSPDNSITFLYTHPGLNFKECEADYKIRDLMEIFLN